MSSAFPPRFVARLRGRGMSVSLWRGGFPGVPSPNSPEVTLVWFPDSGWGRLNSNGDWFARRLEDELAKYGMESLADRLAGPASIFLALQVMQS